MREYEAWTDSHCASCVNTATTSDAGFTVIVTTDRRKLHWTTTSHATQLHQPDRDYNNIVTLFVCGPSRHWCLIKHNHVCLSANSRNEVN